jgi:O-antigen/teichoic acid export membrane protein
MTSDPPDDGKIDARREMKRGLWWMGGATLVMRLLDVGSMLLVLVFLGPGEMGLATLAWSISVVLEAFNGLGVGQVVVRQHDLTHRELSGLFWFCTVLGIAAAAVMAVVAPWIAVFYADPRLSPMVVVSAGKLILVGAALVPLQLLTRDLRFKEAGAAQTIATLGESITKVTLVIAGLGAWGLVIANVSRGLFLLVALCWLSPFRPVFASEDRTTRQSVRFGLRVTMASVLYHAYRNMDFLLIGRFLGKQAVGIYRVAFDLGMTPLDIVLQLVNRVQFPIYSRLQAKAFELRDAFYRSGRSLLLLLGPVTALICFASPDLLGIVGSGKWLAAVPMIYVLSWASLLRGLSQIFPQLYQVTGRPQYAVTSQLLTGATLVGGFLLVLSLASPSAAPQGVAWVWLLSYPVPLAAQFALARRCAPVHFAGMMRALLLPALGVGFVSLLLGAGTLLRPFVHSPIVSLVILTLIGLAGYGVFLHGIMRMRLGDILPGRSP